MKRLFDHLRTPSSFYSKRRWYHPFAIARRLINYYLAICILLFLMQNSLLFPRWMTGAILTPEAVAIRETQCDLVTWDHPAPGVESPQGFVNPDFAKAAPRGTIVVFHGNGGCAYDRAFYRDAFAARGFRTFLYEYPGYGSRPGNPCAASIIDDAQNLIRSLDRMGFGPIYIWGESLGLGIASAVCRDQTLPIHGVALMMPWNSLVYTAAYHYPIAPVAFLLRDKYDSVANLNGFPNPVCIICGTLDPVVPMRLSLDLYEHLTGPKKLMQMDGYGHGDWPNSPDLTWWDDALNFIAPIKLTTPSN